MSHTLETTVAQGAWSDLSGGLLLTHATVQLKSSGPVLIHIGQSLPDPAETAGFTLVRNDEDELSAIPFAGLVSGDNIYARSVQDEDNELVVFLGTDEAIE